MVKMNSMPPAPPVSEGEEMDLFGSEEEMVGEGPDLSEFSDDDLIEELKSRGFEIEEDEMSEEMPEESAEEIVL